MYFKIINDGFISMIGEKISGEAIGREEYDSLLSIIDDKPIAPKGFDYRLKTDLTWELVELPEPSSDDDEATESDYIDALQDLGVEVDA